MAQVQDLQTENLELQRPHQELSQAVSAAAGIRQSYGDPLTQPYVLIWIRYLGPFK